MTTKPQSTTETLESREESICGFCDQAIHLAGDEWKHNFNDSIWCRRTTATPRLSASAAPVVEERAERAANTIFDYGESVRWGQGADQFAVLRMIEIIKSEFAAAPMEQSDEVTLRIPTCGKCPFVDHTGAFTPGGAQPICGHHDAPDTFAVGIEGDQHFHWKYRQVDLASAPPSKCPLRQLVTDPEGAR